MGAKVINTMLAKVLSLLTTMLTRIFMQCQRAGSEIWGDYAKNNHEITQEVHGNYPNIKRNLAEK